MNKYCKNCYELAEKLKQKEQECNTLKSQLDFAVRQKERFEQQCEALKSEGFTRESLITEQENEIDELRQECKELKKANQHIDANRQRKGSKLKRIEELISACETGYTDEFIQKIYGIIQEPEPTINDYSITDRYRKALVEIELTIKNLEKGDILTFPDFTLQENATMIINQCNQGYRDILDIISRAKGS